MEIKVTSIIGATKTNPVRFSASCAETGNQDIGRKTYSAACRQKAFALTAEQDKEWRDYLPEYGAWSEEEIAEWTPKESTGLFVQFVSGDYRTLCHLMESLDYDIDDFTDDQLQEATENEGGSLYKDSEGEWRYYVGS